MDNQIRGTSLRPRVAFLGIFDPEESKRYKELFPTVWSAKNIVELDAKVNVREIDLLIISDEVEGIRHSNVDWSQLVHVICFSRNLGEPLPGPINDTWITLSAPVKSEEYVLPDLTLPFSRRREVDLAKLTSIRDWHGLKINSRQPMNKKAAEEILMRSAIILGRHEEIPLAVKFLRVEANLGIAWLPHPVFDRPSWVELIAMEWAQSDPVRFPNFGDWVKSPEWILPQEEEFLDKIITLENEKKETIARIDQEIGGLATDLKRATLEANKGRRRLLTAQDNELVEEVATVFREFGFRVRVMDEEIDPNAPKREDLRLQDPDGKNKDWEAIVEVRGYKRSSGTSADLGRLARFTEFYLKEKGCLPSKRIYVVNGQIELLLSQRQIPLASAEEDIEVFAEQNGVVISTMDLFRVAKKLGQIDKAAVRESLKSAVGRWTPQNVQDLN